MTRIEGAGVSEKLFRMNSTEVRPGQKVECPFCSHETMAITPDDLLAKCFYPSCGKHITASTTSNDVLGEKIKDWLKEFFWECKQELRGQSLGVEKNARRYLIEERSVHPAVAEAAFVGAIPTEIKCLKKLDNILYEVKDELRDLEKNPRKHADEIKKHQLIISSLDKYVSMLRSGKFVGWIGFFYESYLHEITAVRLREPYSKKIALLKPLPEMGVFGFSICHYHKDIDERPLIILEGEFNFLQLQSLTSRRAQSSGMAIIFQNAIAVGGVLNVDTKTIKLISKRPLVIHDNDLDHAGLELVELINRDMHSFVATTFGVDSDLDSMITSASSDEEAWEELVKITQQASFCERKFESLETEIYTIRLEGKKDVEIHKRVSELIIEDISGRCALYKAGEEAYLFHKQSKSLFRIEPKENLCITFFSDYGLNCTDKIYLHIVEEIRLLALKSGKSTCIHRLSFYDQSSDVLYITNGQNQMYRVGVSHIDLVDNGTDGILFSSSDMIRPFKLVEVGGSESVLDRLVLSSINFSESGLGDLSKGERKVAVLFWVLAIFFRSVLKERPILAFIGPKGSSKSSSLRRIGQLIFGPDFDVMPLSKKSDDFDAATSNSVFVAIDNADTKSEWLPDAMATIATGGKIVKRKLYSDNTTKVISRDCFLAVTSRTPEFTRDDVNDRLLVMPLSRLEGEFVGSNELTDVLMENRDIILTELIFHLQEVVRARKYCKEFKYQGSFRVADFADFSIKVARYLGFQDEMNKILRKLGRDQSKLTVQDDPVARLLLTFVKANPSIEISNKELCRRLHQLSFSTTQVFPFMPDDVYRFAQRMTHLRPNLEEFFTITKYERGGHQVTYRYDLKNGVGNED